MEVLCESCYFSYDFLKAPVMPLARCYEFGPFRLDATGGVLFRDSERLAISPKAIKVLILLVQAQGNPVTKEELLSKVWPDAVVEEGSITSHVSILRKTLGGAADSGQYIETIPKRGYRFLAPVRIAANFNGDLLQRTDEKGPAKTLKLLILSVVSLIMVGIVAWSWAHHKPVKRFNSIAVLPLVNLSGDPSQDYFADGMTDELITTLAKINSLRVISRTSAMRFRGVQRPLPEIAQELKADAIVEGSVTRSGDKVRITAQLVDAGTDQHLWAQDYDGTLNDALILQNKIARAIADEIGAKLTPHERVQLSTDHLVDPLAYEAYLKGRFHWNKRTESELKNSITYFEQAISTDSGYSLAYVGLGDSYNILGSWAFAALPPREAREKAVSYADKALAIDDGLSEAHASLGNAKVLFDWDWEGGEAEFKRAIALNPNYANAHHWYAELLLDLGRFDESVRESYRAKELDPLSPSITGGLARRLLYAGQVAEAMKESGSALELESSVPLLHRFLGDAYLRQGKNREAISEFEKAVQLSNSSPNDLADLAYAHAVAGEAATARRDLGRLIELSRTRYVSPYQLAAVHVGLQEKQKALEELRKAYQERSTWMINLRVDPRFDPLRSEPAFASLLTELRFPEH